LNKKTVIEMVYKERTTQNTGRVARAFHAFTHAHEMEEACLPNSAEVKRGFSLKEESDREYLWYKAQLAVNQPLFK